MRRLVWSDNIGTVGWTCVWGVFSADDMDFLLSICPNGSFSPTNFSTRNCTTPDRLRSSAYSEISSYFNFRLDEDGKTLLMLLRLRGMEDVRLKQRVVDGEKDGRLIVYKWI